MKTIKKHPQYKRLFGPGYDGVVEAVRLTSGGKIQFVRAYERRGPTFSDHLLIDRAALVDRIKSGQRFVTGRRVPNHGSEFEIADEVKLLETAKGETLISGDDAAQNDHLKGVPVL
ncbi:MAG: hypothetical protein PVF83_18725 [Anaerolineales bacterium]|jgi:hypothetical protein